MCTKIVRVQLGNLLFTRILSDSFSTNVSRETGPSDLLQDKQFCRDTKYTNSDNLLEVSVQLLQIILLVKNGSHLGLTLTAHKVKSLI